MYKSELNSKMFNRNTWLSKLIIVVVETVLSRLVSSALRIAAIPSSVGILEYRSTTSIETGKAFGGIDVVFNDSICLSKSGVSCRKAGINGTF